MSYSVCTSCGERKRKTLFGEGKCACGSRVSIDILYLLDSWRKKPVSTTPPQEEKTVEEPTDEQVERVSRVLAAGIEIIHGGNCERWGKGIGALLKSPQPQAAYYKPAVSQWKEGDSQPTTDLPVVGERQKEPLITWEAMMADEEFMSWLNRTQPDYDIEFSGTIKRLHVAWLAGKSTTPTAAPKELTAGDIKRLVAEFVIPENSGGYFLDSDLFAQRINEFFNGAK